MRLPLTPQLSSRDGEVNKNARRTNVLIEMRQGGNPLATVRPGLVPLVSDSGAGKGVHEFNGDLMTVFANDLHVIDGGLSVAVLGAVEGDMFDFVQSTI